VEDLQADEAAVCRALLNAMGVDPEAAGKNPDAARVTTLLAADLTLSGSISYAFGAAWENARGAREAISSELWEALNSTHRELRRRTRETSTGAHHDFFGWVRDRAATCTGLVDSTMSRDDGWRFFVLGRSLERADMTMRALSTPYGPTFGRVGWTTTLRSCSAYEAYVRTYHHAVDASSSVEFLLLDRLFPRSVYHTVHTAELRLMEINPSASRSRVDDDARRLLGRLRSQLEFLRVDEVLDDLPQLLRRLQGDCTAVHGAIARRYFQETRAIEWSA
jgi:uncharacterized alpha-E superfamily protein